MTLIAALFALLAPCARAEQNFFNVPTSEITRQGELFFQEQLNLTTDSTLSSYTTFVYGLGDGWEAGANLFNLSYALPKGRFVPGEDVPAQPRGRLLLMNAQKGFELSERLSLGVGSELGWALSPEGGPAHRQAGLLFANLAYELEHGGARLVAGAYAGTLAYRGAGSIAGLWLGASVPVAFGNRLQLVADSILGSNGLSVSVLGGSYAFSPKFILSTGWQLPSPGSSDATDSGGVFEITAFF